MGYLGGINKFCLTDVDFMVSDTSDDGARRMRDCTYHNEFMLRDVFGYSDFYDYVLETMFCMAYGL